MMPAPSKRLLGMLAMGLTVTIWASLFISLRQASQSALTSGDIALLRFLPAALLFGWLSRYRVRHIFAAPKRYLFAIAFGAGLPFYLLAATGMQFAPVADGASLIPGILPLFVSAIAWAVYGESLSIGRRLGISLIVLGIGAFFMALLVLFILAYHPRSSHFTGGEYQLGLVYHWRTRDRIKCCGSRCGISDIGGITAASGRNEWAYFV